MCERSIATGMLGFDMPTSALLAGLCCARDFGTKCLLEFAVLGMDTTAAPCLGKVAAACTVNEKHLGCVIVYESESESGCCGLRTEFQYGIYFRRQGLLSTKFA